ncbi:MAG: M10 family metallopeptidase C-terminal domain-containing protein, partial [Allosphingosinicella sp.]
GGGGADTFRYDSTADSNSASMDQILDFTPGTDRMDLTRIDARTNLAGNQAFTWIGSNAFTGTAGQLRAFQQGGDWILQGDVDGDGVADLVIALTLQGPTPLSASDFVLLAWARRASARREPASGGRAFLGLGLAGESGDDLGEAAFDRDPVLAEIDVGEGPGSHSDVSHLVRIDRDIAGFPALLHHDQLHDRSRAPPAPMPGLAALG